MDPLALVAALGAGLSVALVITAVARRSAGQRSRAQERVAALVGGAAAAAVFVPEESLLRDRGSGPGLLGRLFTRDDGTDEAAAMLERAGLPLRPHEFQLMKVFGAVIGGGAGFVGGGLLAGGGLPGLFSALPPAMLQGVFTVLGLGVGFWLPGWYVRGRISKRAALIEDQLVEMLELMASSMSAGFGYMQALVATSQQLEAPLSEEILKMVDEVNLGGDIDEALHALEVRLQSKDFDIVSTAITIQRTAGGNLGEILRGVAQTIRARQSFQRDVAALTAKESQTALIMSGFPILMAVGLMFMATDPYGRLVSDPVGQIAFGSALALDAIGYMVIKQMTKIEV